MKTAKRSRKTVKGAVLIMVLTVMFVLIFLLAGTIAVVYSANNRAMAKYQESQAYYTARSILDTYIDTLLKDNDNVMNSSDGSGRSAVNYYYIDDTVTPMVQANVNPKQARSFELDLYKLAVDVDAVTAGVQTTVTTDANMPDWLKVYILELATGIDDPVKSLLTGVTRNNTVTEAEQARGIYATSNATDYAAAKTLALKVVNPSTADFNDTVPGESTPYASFTQYYTQFVIASADNDIIYEIPTASLSSYGQDASGKSYGKVYDTGTAPRIKVEMLERKYHLGTTGTKFKERFDGGSREKDYVKIRATCELMYNGELTTTSIIYQTKYDPKPSSNKAIVSLSDISSGTSLRAYGGATSLQTSDLNWTNNSGTSGNVFLNGGVSFGTTDYYPVMSKENVFFARKNIKLGNAPTTTYLETGATFFTDLFETSAKGIGSATNKVNVVCTDYKIAGEPSSQTHGRVFAENFTISNSYNNNKKAIDGDVYCNYLVLPQEYFSEAATITSTTTHLTTGTITMYDGNKDINNIIENGGFYIAKGYKFTDSTGNVIYTAEPDPVNAGKWIVTTPLSTITVDSWNEAALTKKSGSCTELKLDYEAHDEDGNSIIEAAEQDFTYDDTSFKRKLTLPADLIGVNKNELELDTLKSMYNNYFDPAATTGGSYNGEPFDEFGDFNANMTDFGTFFDDPSTTADDTQYNNFRTFIEEHVVKPIDRNAQVESTSITNITMTTVDATDPDLTAYAGWHYINSDTMIMGENLCNMTLGPNSFNSDYCNRRVVIDTRGGEVNIQMGNGTDGGQFAGTYVVVGDNNVNILFPASAPGVEYTLGNNKDFKLYDADLGDDPATLRLGSSTSATEPPNIQILVSEKVSKITYGQHSTAIQGYVYAPYTKFDVGGGNNGYTVTNMIIDDTNTGNAPVSVIGSIFCAGYVSSQIVGVAYIDPDKNTIPAGDKVFAWADVLYTRGE